MAEDEPDFSGLFKRSRSDKPVATSKKPETKKDLRAKLKRKAGPAGATGKPKDDKPRLSAHKRNASSLREEGRDKQGPAVAHEPVHGSPVPAKKQRVSEGFWPFKVDYNDHFETSSRAIQDIQPILSQLCKKLKRTPSQLVVYDPFFCKGGIRKHYEALGFTNFVHRKRDFYADVESGNLPEYDILVTNPPYSEDHKERALDFCLRSGKPWALLLPNYVATKAYFAELVDAAATPPAQRPFFLTPRVRYSYDHPEGTGHAESPFFSIWYVGLGPHTEAVYGACRTRLDSAAAGGAGGAGAAEGAAAKGKQPKKDSGSSGSAWDVSLARCVDALRQAGAVPTAKRLNPKQRQRLKKKAAQG